MVFAGPSTSQTCVGFQSLFYNSILICFLSRSNKHTSFPVVAVTDAKIGMNGHQILLFPLMIILRFVRVVCFLAYQFRELGNESKIILQFYLDYRNFLK